VTLARDAIRKFTKDVSHRVWVMDHEGSHVWPHGSLANGLALDMMIGTLTGTHIFCMHSDALPLRNGWLGILVGHHMDVIGTQASQRNGFPHASGVLFTHDFARTHSMMPDDERNADAAEWPGFTFPHRTNQTSFGADFSLYAERPIYAHLGGGTIGAGNMKPNSREHAERIKGWIAYMRREFLS